MAVLTTASPTTTLHDFDMMEVEKRMRRPRRRFRSTGLWAPERGQEVETVDLVNQGVVATLSAMGFRTTETDMVPHAWRYAAKT